MALRFSPPPFDERRQAPDLSASFEAFMNAYARSKQLGLAEQQAQNQQTTFNQQQADRGIQNQMTWGTPNPTPEYVADVGRAAQTGFQGPILPSMQTALENIVRQRAISNLAIPEKEAGIDLERAKAEALRREKSFVDFNTGQVITAPAGAVAAPRGPVDNATLRERAKAKTEYADNTAAFNELGPQLKKLVDVNKNSFEGAVGSIQMKARSASGIGTEDERFKNTANVVNQLKSLVSRALKSTFGGQLSDSERAYLNEVYGAAEKYSKVEREIALNNVLNTLESKARQAGEKASMLGVEIPQSGSYTERPLSVTGQKSKYKVVAVE